ncbi:hypothetical protein fugu_009123 [Takifugu bimaculatus]|uniref:RNA methyltransferase n=1 Tax=Takifugu bimaculatus TaxID=433685 RepID=A0A4Z2AZ88_9TELE|nr:hypothetical protein fugu_009123 [Takifugu bimaculatus]
MSLSERAGSYSAISVTVEAPEFAASCPVLAAAAPANHASDALAEPRDAQQRAKGSDNILNRRNTWQHSKQQQQTKLAKRRNTANTSFKHPSSGKRRRRATSESDSVLPTNFLLGGNIFDPLNLNSLLDEEVNRALNAETPKSSPLPARSRDPVEILIPRDITDPLNLKSGIADSNVLASPFKRKRHRNRHHGGGGGGGVLGAGSGISSAQMNSLEQEKSDGIPTPLPGVLASVSTPDVSKESNSFSSATGDSNELSAENSIRLQGRDGLRLHGRVHVRQSAPEQTQATAQLRENGAPFDPVHAGGKVGTWRQKRRVGVVEAASVVSHAEERVQEWFEGKDVLDLGCNLGHLTLYIAKMHRPARILGLDIDGALVHAARKNIRHYLSELQAQEARQSAPCTKRVEEAEHQKHKEPASVDENRTPAEGETETRRQDGTAEEMERGDGHSPPTELSVSFPVSLQISRGPIAAPPLSEASTVRRGEFPSNVSFIKANYVLENDGLLLTQRQEYDVILCLSVTKWVHLNWGDTGLKRLFKRVYRHLRSGGLFILEPQPWESYVRRKKLTDNINKNFHSIRLKPDQFSSYLTTEVGFTRFEYLGAPKCSIKGFQRPIFLFHK